MNLYLYLISQSVNNGYDTYDSAVVCAENEDEARGIHPSGYRCDGDRWCSDWCESVEDVEVQYLGKAADDIPSGVVCSSFNAG
jgi:hypothetical protein